MIPRVCKICQGQKGVTLVELAVAMAVLVFIAVFVVQPIAQYVKLKKKNDLMAQILAVKTIFETAYDQNAWWVDSQAGAVFSLQDGSRIDAGDTDGTQNHDLSVLQKYVNWVYQTSDINRDVWQSPWHIFISNRLTDGDLQYHIIAVVSKGEDGVLSSTFDQNTGRLALGGDDIGVVVDGLSIEQKKSDETKGRLDHIASAYATYFETLFLADAARDTTVDHFARTDKNGNTVYTWDSSSAVENTCFVTHTGDCYATVNDAGLANLLHLSAGSEQSAWGRVLYVKNDTWANRDVRSPSNSSDGPYTAQVCAELPWGGWLCSTAVPAY